MIFRPCLNLKLLCYVFIVIYFTGADETQKSTWFAYEVLAFLGDRNNPRKRRNTEVTAFN